MPWVRHLWKPHSPGQTERVITLLRTVIGEIQNVGNFSAREDASSKGHLNFLCETATPDRQIITLLLKMPYVFLYLSIFIGSFLSGSCPHNIGSPKCTVFPNFLYCSHYIFHIKHLELSISSYHFHVSNHPFL